MNTEQKEAGLASDLNRELEALREERDVFFDAHHNSSLLIKKLEQENDKLKTDNEKWARAWQKAENEKLNAEYNACVKADLYVADLREMLQCVADDEITVAKAEELIRAWVAGNYDKDCLPNV